MDHDDRPSNARRQCGGDRLCSFEPDGRLRGNWQRSGLPLLGREPTGSLGLQNSSAHRECQRARDFTESPDVVFAASASVVYRSPDGAQSWTDARGTGTSIIPPGAVIRSLTTGPGALYAGATSGVFTSADRGVTWYDYSRVAQR